MLFRTPDPSPELTARLEVLDGLRRQLGHDVSTAGPWLGTLRRSVKARSVEGSTSIEGYTVSHEDAIALISGGEPASQDDAGILAVSCYSHAMDHVGVMASDDSAFRWLDRVILDLHFDACSFQGDKDPGRWRKGSIFVSRNGDDPSSYAAPDGGEVAALMSEVSEWLDHGDLDSHPVVRAAMAHLHVVSVHPFRDGNGRIARIVQSLVLAREGLLSPEFGSIEEFLGRNTPEYYSALERVQGDYYQPDRDASGWTSFCVEAHIVQAEQRLEQIVEAASRWSALEEIVVGHGWPDRLVIALEQSLIGGTDRGRYSDEAGVSFPTASADLRRLLDTNLVRQVGQARSTRYVASDLLKETIEK